MAVDHTTAQQILQAAHEAVKGAKLPASLEVSAFEKAVDLIAAQGWTDDRGRPPSATSTPPGERGGDQNPDEPGKEKTLGRIASKLKVSPDVVGEIFHKDGDELKLSPAASKFESARSAATKQLALLIAAGRQAGGWDEEWTASAEIRKVCTDYGKFDSGNFATTLTEMGDVFGFSGTGQSRKVKVNRKGLEETAKMIRELAGEEST